MKLTQQEFLILDCQTTGMRPSVGHLLEIAWVWAKADGTTEEPVQSRLIRLPEGDWIPPRVKEITGITDDDMATAFEAELVRQEFLAAVAKAEGRPVALAHYAQFEEPFLKAFLGVEELPFDLLCTHKLSKRLFPHVPSRNIRGLTGFFGVRIGDIKRAEAHVRATREIWKGLTSELDKQGLVEYASVCAWLSTPPPKPDKKAPKAKAPSYEYRVDRTKRLGLPEKPGVYRMRAKSGEILYVGKATCLKDRVNSYFRGKRGRDPRKLELMAQVWDLDYIECNSAIEAALLESDEIKKYDPPYNVVLKTGRRGLAFYSRDFESSNVRQDDLHPIGPFKRYNYVEMLRALRQSFESALTRHKILQVFQHEEFEIESLEGALALFCEKERIDAKCLRSMRGLMALALQQFRKHRKEPEVEAAAVEELDQDPDAAEEEIALITPEELAAKFGRLFVRAGAEYARAKRMTRLLNARVRWQDKDGWKSLETRRGRLDFKTRSESIEPDDAGPTFPWNGLEIADYDRISILLAEISRYPHEIESGTTLPA